jgi:MFS transporter, CP family, cyanate transporter
VSRTQSTPVAPGQKLVRLERTLLVIGVLALGFNLRTAITSLPPVFPELQTSLGLSSATISVLAATPVICFGVVSGFAALLARRAGEERVLLAAIIVLTVGLVVRAVAPGALLFPGTILASGAIAVMNVLLSSLIKRRWPERAGFLIGMYITALSAGAIVGSVVSVPLWQDTGGSVALTLGWMAAPAALAILLWLPQARSRSTSGSSQTDSGATNPAGTLPGGGGQAARPARVAVYRYALTWYVTLFMGMQSLLYYATLSWLPTMLRDRGESAAGAGDLLALMGVGNLAVSMLVPMAAQRMRSQVTLVVPTAIAITGGLAALLYAPLGGAVAWALILGAGQNAALALAIYFTAARAPHAAVAASLSSFAQAVGYLLASAGPLEVGLLHSATGSWTAPVMVLFALSAVLLVAGILAARPRMLPLSADAEPAAAEAEGNA